MKKIGVLATVSAVIVAVSSWVAAQTAIPANPKNGEKIYEAQCLRCHGPNLEGDGPEAKSLVVPPANLQSLRSRSKTDWELLVVISHGVIFSPMHAWRDKLTEQELWDVISYIRMRAPFNPVT